MRAMAQHAGVLLVSAEKIQPKRQYGLHAFSSNQGVFPGGCNRFLGIQVMSWGKTGYPAGGNKGENKPPLPLGARRSKTRLEPTLKPEARFSGSLDGFSIPLILLLLQGVFAAKSQNIRTQVFPRASNSQNIKKANVRDLVFVNSSGRFVPLYGFWKRWGSEVTSGVWIFSSPSVRMAQHAQM